MDNHVPYDGEVFKLSREEDATRAEFVNTNGRIAWRLYDRHGRGVLLTKDEMRLLSTLTNNALADEDSE